MPPLRRNYPPRSATKEQFLAYLGLNDQEHSHKQLYRRMLDEASAGRDRLSQDPNNLYPNNKLDPNVRPPYSADNMMETAMHQEVLNIWKLASSETRKYYDFGSIHDSAVKDNWVIRWCLWHVFRYRDNRNSNNRRPSPNDEPRDAYGQRLTSGNGTASVYWDPIRN